MKYLKTIKECFNDKLECIADSLIEQNPEKYSKKVDLGYYHNGIGFVSCGNTYSFNEDGALDDAKEEFIKDIDNCDNKEYLLEMLDNEDFRKALIEFVRGL